VRGGSRLFQDQAECPFRAVSLHRLDLREQQDDGDALNPLEQGTDLHASLHRLLGRYPSRSALAGAGPEELSAAVREAAAEGLRHLERERGVRVPPRLREVEAKRIEALLRAWIETDLARPEFEVLEREAVKRLAVEGLEVSLKVDRVDRMADGGEVILDYKSGDSALPNDDDRLGAPQLPLYALACPAARAVAYAVLDPAQWGPKVVQAAGTAPFGKAKKRPKTVEDWEALRRTWRGKLEELALEFRSGRADLATTDRVCGRCALPSFCRWKSTADSCGKDEP
jgi:ATP-dependent helicase/nuclease subunit B